MPLIVNGDPYPMPTPATIAGLIRDCGFHSVRLAVEKNGEIVPRSQWESTAIADGDKVELVRAIGGG